jgi:hypothetical protein
MIDAVAAVRQLAPDLLHNEVPSVACVRTTTAKYLIFGADATRPVCVVDFGGAARLQRVDRILSALHPLIPDVVAHSICCTCWRHATHVHLQSGLPGAPWFRVADTLATRADWERLLDRAAATMARLHRATASVPYWCGAVDVGAALSAAAREFLVSTPGADARLWRHLAASAERLRGVVRPAVWQHGDFALNNLLVSPQGIAVIDFDEFGETMMPLHDAFGLALSFHLSQDRCPLSLAECIDRCVRADGQDEELSAEAIAGLFLHHLLWRINRDRAVATRARLRERLLALLSSLADESASGLDTGNRLAIGGLS